MPPAVYTDVVFFWACASTGEPFFTSASTSATATRSRTRPPRSSATVSWSRSLESSLSIEHQSRSRRSRMAGSSALAGALRASSWASTGLPKSGSRPLSIMAWWAIPTRTSRWQAASSRCMVMQSRYHCRSGHAGRRSLGGEAGQPAREEGSEVAARGALHGRAQVGALHAAVARARRRVIADAAPERVLAQVASQGVQQQRAPRIHDGATRLAGRLPGREDERAVLALPVDPGHPFPRQRHLAVVGLAAPAFLLPGRGHERREAFVEPEVGPAAAGEEVAPPLMRELVGDRPVLVRIFEERLRVVGREEREVHHLLRRRSGQEDLGVRRVGQGKAGSLLEEPAHRVRLRQHGRELRREVRGSEDAQAHASLARLERLPASGGEAVDVGGPGLTQVVLGLDAAVGAGAHAAGNARGDEAQAGGRGQSEGRGGAVAGIALGDHPAPRREHREGLVGGRAQTAAGMETVSHVDRAHLARARAALPADRKALALVGKRQRHVSFGNRVDQEPVGVEEDLVHATRSDAQADRLRSLRDRFPQWHLEPHVVVEDVHIGAGRSRGRGECEKHDGEAGHVASLMGGMKVVVFGATGMVGQGALRECLLDPGVEAVLAVGRRGTGQSHPKLREIVHRDFLDFSGVERELAGYDACLYALGVSSAGMSEPDYVRVTYDFALAAAQAVLRNNPAATFVFVSGASTDGTEQGRIMWARVKGR